MSKTARTTLWTVLVIVALMFAYGKGHQHGRRAQLTFDAVIEICAAQFFDAVKEQQKKKGSK